MTEFDPLRSSAPLIVYVDFKSPYAYLAIEPTYALAGELGIDVDWRALTLDIPSFAGSARLGPRDEVVESRRSPEQWTGIRYAYRDARRYASLRGLTLRGTVKIWDSSLAGIGLSWAKGQGARVLRAYTETVYERFWRRELDLEDVAVIESVLRESGADTSGFRAHADGEGRARHDAEQRAIFDAGIFGVPAFVVDGEWHWGREHLPRVRWALTGRRGPAPDVAYEAGAPSGPRADALSIAIDVKSPQCWLALAPTLALADSLGLDVDWQPFLVPPPRRLAPASAGDDRGARHRRLRAEYAERDLARYASARGLPLRKTGEAPKDTTLAALGLLWAKRVSPRVTRAYVERVFDGHWRETLDVADAAALARLLVESGATAPGFDAFVRHEGPAQLEAARAALVESGVFDAPTYRVGSDVFLGRQHLPLVREMLSR